MTADAGMRVASLLLLCLLAAVSVDGRPATPEAQFRQAF